MLNNKIFVVALAITLLLPATVLAKPQVSVAIKAEKEVVVTEEGKQVKKMVEAKEVLPGETILYSLDYSNTGDEAATDLVISDPLPEGTTFVAGSATEVGDLSFSIDGGKTYKKPTLLTYEVVMPDGSKEVRVASPELYTHVRWILPRIAAGGSGTIHFKVKVK